MAFLNFSDDNIPVFPGDLVQIIYSSEGPPPDLGIVDKQFVGMMISYELNEFGNDQFRLWTASGLQDIPMPGPILRTRGRGWDWSLKKLS